MKYLIQKKTGVNLIEVEFNPQDSNIGNNVIKYDYEDKSISKNIEIRSSIVTIRFLDKELNRVLLEREIKIGTLFETDIYTTRRNSLVLDHNGMAIGFKISDGRLGKDGLHKEYFSRVINEDTDIECEMLRFDYYFANTNEYHNLIDGILGGNNNDLSSFTMGFSDDYFRTSINLFMNKPITKTPKMIISRSTDTINNMFRECVSLERISSELLYYVKNVETTYYIFSNCVKISEIPKNLFLNNDKIVSFENCFYKLASLLYIPEGLFDNCPNARDFGAAFCDCSLLESIPIGLFDNNPNLWSVSTCFAGCYKLKYVPSELFENNNLMEYVDSVFQDDSEIISKLPDVWNKEKFPNVIDGKYYARGCTKVANYAEIPSNFK